MINFIWILVAVGCNSISSEGYGRGGIPWSAIWILVSSVNCTLWKLIKTTTYYGFASSFKLSFLGNWAKSY